MSISMPICVSMSVCHVFVAAKFAGFISLVWHVYARIASEETYWLQSKACRFNRHDRKVFGTHNMGQSKAMP